MLCVSGCLLSVKCAWFVYKLMLFMMGTLWTHCGLCAEYGFQTIFVFMIHMNKLVENEMMIYICFPIGLIAVMMAQFVLALSDHSLHCKSFLFLSEICCIRPFFLLGTFHSLQGKCVIMIMKSFFFFFLTWYKDVRFFGVFIW